MSTMDDRPVPKRWPMWVSGFLSILLLLVSLVLAVTGGAVYNDTYSHETDRAWGIACLVAGGLLFVASSVALVFLLIRKPSIGLAAIVFHGLALIAHVVVVVEGFPMMADAKRRGGDWGALAVFGSLLFGIIVPILIGLMTSANSYLLYCLRRQVCGRDGG